MDDCSKKSDEFVEEIEELVSYVEGGGRDRTDGEQGDDSIQNFESELREIFEHTAVGMYRTAPDGRILLANPALVRMLGFSGFEELAQRNLEESGFEPDYRRKLFKERIEKEGKIVGLESVWMTRQGKRLIIIENARVVRDQDQNVLYYEGTAENITERKEAEEALRYRLEFERLISTLSTRFIEPGDIDRKINETLAAIGEFVGVDRAYVFQIGDDGGTADNMYEWCAEGVDAQIDNLKGVSIAEELPLFWKAMMGHEVFHVAAVAELPAEAKLEKEHFEMQDIQAVVVVPMLIQGKLSGFLGFDSVRSKKTWPSDIIALLQITGENISLALARKKAEAALARSEARLRSIFRAAPVGIGLVSDRVLLNVNERVCEMTGYSRDELVGENARILYPTDEDYEYVGREKYGQIRKRGTGTVETRWRHKDGRVIDVLLSSTPLDPKDLSAGVTFTALDITDRKRAGRALRQEKDRAQTYLDVAGVMFVVIGIDRKVKLINKRGCDVLGYDEDEILGKDWFDNFLPDSLREDVGAVFDTLIAGGIEPAEYYENPIIGKDGSERLIAWHNIVLRDESDKIIGSLGSGEDITERKRAEEVLRAEKNKLTAIFEAMVDGAYIVNKQYDIEYVNPVLEKGFGPWQGRKCYEYFHDRKEICSWCKNKDVFAGKTVRWEWYSFKNDKTYDLIDTPLQNLDGSVSKLGIFRDVTERKEAEEKARERQSEFAHVWRVNTMGEMASGLAHELNQPLCAILNYANASLRMMKNDVAASGELIDPIEQIATQAERAGEIIKRIRGLIAKRKPQSSAVDINGIVREVVAMERNEASLREITVRTELGEDLPEVMVDNVEIEEVILNLVRNAFDAMSDVSVERREVTIVTCMTKIDKVEVCVRDTGKGFAGFGERIFDSFFTTKADGLGIGLSISRTIVESHGGKLWAETNPDCGASFRFTLPVKGA